MRTVSAGKAEKDDALVTVSGSGTDEPYIVFNSPVRILFRVAQDRIVRETLVSLDATDLNVEIHDFHALDYVLAARLQAAVSRHRSGDNP